MVPTPTRSTLAVIAAIAATVLVTGTAAILAFVKPAPAPDQRPAVAVPDQATTLPFDSLSATVYGVAVDAAGNVYAADSQRIWKLGPGSSHATKLHPSYHVTPNAIAVDARGNVYVADLSRHRVVKMPVDETEPVVLPFPLPDGASPSGVAVDAADNVFVVAYRDGQHSWVWKLAPDAGSAIELPFPVLNLPAHVAVDASGSVYVTEAGHPPNEDANRGWIWRLAKGDSAAQQIPVGLRHPQAIAIGSDGSVFAIESWGHASVWRLTLGSSDKSLLPFPDQPTAIAVGGSGTVYVGGTTATRAAESGTGWIAAKYS